MVKSDDEKRARLNGMQHFLTNLDDRGTDTSTVRGPDALIVDAPSQVIEKERHLWG